MIDASSVAPDRRPAIAGRIRRRIFGISPVEATFARRGFRARDERARERLERAGGTFVQGYHAALEDPRPHALARRLGTVDTEVRGFAFEGAAMALALLDLLTPWNRGRWRAFADGPAEPHRYIVHVGVGWALARVPRRVEPILARLDSLLSWLAIDGFGFHEGYFHAGRYLGGGQPPRRLAGYARRAFDQGLGRSLWFSLGADVPRIAEAIAALDIGRHADLWSGVGLAAAYAGGVGREALEALRGASGVYLAHVAQGAAFAAKARERAGNPAAHTALACEVLCGKSAEEAARVTDEALDGLPGGDGQEPRFEVWRAKIRSALG